MGQLVVSDTRIAWLIAAATLLLAAHVVRAYRWSLLFPRTEASPDRRGLLRSLGIGYAVNAILPLRIGEIVRAIVATRLRGARLAEVFATVVAERVADIVIVTAFVFGAWLSGRTNGFPLMALASAATVFTLAGGAVVLRHSIALRRGLWFLAGLFNPRVRVGVADFAWSTAEILAGGTLVRWQFTITTFVMWAVYLAAYSCFATAIGTSQASVVEALLLQPFTSMLHWSSDTGISAPALRFFVLAPVATIIAGYLLYARWLKIPARAPILPYRGPQPHFAASTRYRHGGGYHGFLDALFSDARSAVSGFGMRAVGDCVVHRYFNGGSEALTALVETRDRMLIRKFGMGAAALKLKQQADWLQRHERSSLPLVPVLNPQSGHETFCYDMPAWDRTSEYYEAIHSNPLTDSSRTLLKALHGMDVMHGATNDIAHPTQVDAYLARKVSDNADQIVRFARQTLGDDAFTFNGVDYHLDEWNAFQDPAWLNDQVQHRRSAVIHGDFTIENIVVAPDHAEGYYVIDPNPENIFDSPLIDWAKMMQSLHLGYEGLNRSSPVTRSDTRMTVPITRSEAYANLHNLLESEIVSRFSKDVLREVYFHELVNYLRLTPYKARQSAERGLAFFACTSMLLRKYQQAYA